VDSNPGFVPGFFLGYNSRLYWISELVSGDRFTDEVT
jgi:hypothetical protein